MIDVAYAFGLSFLPYLFLMFSQASNLKGLPSLPELPYTYFLFAVGPFLSLLSLWHTYIAIPIFIVLFSLALVVQRRVIKIILMALLFITWQGYGMMCLTQQVKIPF